MPHSALSQSSHHNVGKNRTIHNGTFVPRIDLAFTHYYNKTIETEWQYNNRDLSTNGQGRV